MNKTTLLTISLLFILFFTSCKTLKKNNCDCPHFGTTPVKNSETNS